LEEEEDLDNANLCNFFKTEEAKRGSGLNGRTQGGFFILALLYSICRDEGGKGMDKVFLFSTPNNLNCEGGLYKNKYNINKNVKKEP
jgi:hypothetical protein